MKSFVAAFRINLSDDEPVDCICICVKELLDQRLSQYMPGHADAKYDCLKVVEDGSLRKCEECQTPIQSGIGHHYCTACLTRRQEVKSIIKRCKKWRKWYKEGSFDHPTKDSPGDMHYEFAMMNLLYNKKFTKLMARKMPATLAKIQVALSGKNYEDFTE